MAKSRLFTIAPGVPFLNELACSIMDGRLELRRSGVGSSGVEFDPTNPLALAKATIYLPTRRAATLFADIMAAEIRRRTGHEAALLPRIMPLGGLDEAEVDLISMSQVVDSTMVDSSLEDKSLAPAILPLRRQLLLARQIETWGRTVNRAMLGLDAVHFRLIPDRLGEAVGLAAHLADLIDTLHSSGVSFHELSQLDVSGFDRLWEFTHGFLKIAGEWWPTLLAAENAIDPARRRNLLIDAECERIDAARLEGPVIAAGSTGSVPATARLLAAIARSASGAVVLPGLDPWLDDASWALLTRHVTKNPDTADLQDTAISHPQAVMARLISQMNVARQDVMELGRPSPALQARARLASEALRPAETTDQWHQASAYLTAEICEDALRDVSLIEAADEREEALAIALVLREALEDPKCHAALVTPDRGLAERVAVELSRWQVDVDDSAGKPLSRSPHGHLASLVVDLVTGHFASPVLLAVLSHPLLDLGLARDERQRAVSALEIAVLRGGLDGLRAKSNLRSLQDLCDALDRAPSRIGHPHAAFALRRIGSADLALAKTLIQRLQRALLPLSELSPAEGRNASLDMAAIAAAHALAVASLTSSKVADEDSSHQTQPAIFTGPAGTALLTLLDAMATSGVGLLKGDLTDYADMLAELLGAEVVAPQHKGKARITILGLLEARLLHADVMVLAGLNEGTWPPQTSSDPFLNRPMRQKLGLPVPERRIGQSAHDLTQGFASTRLVMTRCEKAGLAQTVPSRFWQRVQAVSPPKLWGEAAERGMKWLQLARQLGQPQKVAASGRPEPLPHASLQPTRYSVTEIETLYRDPYAVYARRILKLDQLEPLEQEIDASDRGTLLHDIVARFAESWRVALPENAADTLMMIGRGAFAPLMHEPAVAAFWWPRFEKIAAHYLVWEVARRPLIATLATEAKSSLELGLADGTTVKLMAKADRIEQLHDGRLQIIDFKSGRMPSDKEIMIGLAAQLTLQAAMAAKNGFGAIGAAPVSAMAYVALKASEKGTLKTVEKTQEKDDLANMAKVQLEELGKVLMKYRQGERGFISRAMPRTLKDAGPYDALARVKEWSRFTISDEDGAEGGS